MCKCYFFLLVCKLKKYSLESRIILEEDRRYYMATSSITHNFVISNPRSVKRFIKAISEAENDRSPEQTLPGRELTDSKEILALMSKRKKISKQ